MTVLAPFVLSILSASGISPALAKLIGIAVLAVALIAGYGIWHHHVFQNGHDVGYNDALVAIGKQDSKAVEKAKEYRSNFKSSDCRAKGLRWSQATGDCVPLEQE
jgi:hypothetical protein